MDFHELSAFVEVESVQDNICIPLHQDVPLIQLYPTKTQEDPILNMDFTANFIDQLRYCNTTSLLHYSFLKFHVQLLTGSFTTICGVHGILKTERLEIGQANYWNLACDCRSLFLFPIIILNTLCLCEPDPSCWVMQVL